MSAAAGGTGTSRAQQLKRIDARVIVIPCDREFFGLFIGSNARWFFVHYYPLQGRSADLPYTLWCRDVAQKVRCGPTDARIIIGRDEIPPRISIHFARTILYNKYL